MKRTTIHLLLVASLLLGACNTEPSPSPNIVFILADDLGYSDLACFGAEFLQTPNIDELATNGLRFVNFYNTGRCWPTRTSLMSGFYPHQVLSDRIDGIDYNNGSYTPSTTAWLPSLLQNHGYRCYHSGKWHLFRRVPKHIDVSMEEVGFNRSYKTEDGRHLNPVRLFEDDQAIAGPEPGSGYEASSAIVDYGIKYLEEHAREHPGTPFFSYLAFIAPHFPLQALQEDIDAYYNLFSPGWNELRKLRAENMEELGYAVHELEDFEPERFAPWNLTQDELMAQIDSNDVAYAVPWDNLSPDQQEFQTLKMAIHAAMITRMDREIGRFVKELEAQGYLDNTIIFFCSDNGASTEIMNRADKHRPGAIAGAADSYVCLGPGWSTAANTPFRLHKTWLHEGGIATPMVVHWPDGIRDKGSFRHIPSHIIDIAPTLLELAGGSKEELRAKADAPGISLLPYLERDHITERTPIFFHHEQKKALRAGDWKITTIEEEGEWELYNLAVDRGETNNLAQEKPDKLRQLVALWEQQRNTIVEQISDNQ